MSCSLNDALEIAREAHTGQTRVGGASYITHVQRVVDSLVADPTNYPGEVFQAAALHDVIEDSSITSAELLRRGVDDRVVVAVEALTRWKCAFCHGAGKLVNYSIVGAAATRIIDEFPGQFRISFVNKLAELALGELATQHCQPCNGGGWSDNYDEYLARVAQDPIAITVKRADAWDNFQDDGRPGMKMKYWKVLRYLRDLPGACGETEFRGCHPNDGWGVTLVSPEECPWTDECTVALINDKKNITCPEHGVTL